MYFTTYRRLYLIARNLIKYTIGLPILLSLSIVIGAFYLVGIIFNLIINAIAFIVGEEVSTDNIFDGLLEVLEEIWKPVEY